MSVPDFDLLAQAGIKRLRAYDPGHDIVALRRKFAESVLVELGSNENPLGPSPRAHAAVRSSLADLHRYPDPLGTDLKRALADHMALEPTQIMLGNGSHELLMMLAQVFAGPGVDVLASEFGFAVYAIAAQAADAGFTRVPALPLDGPMPRGHDLAAIAAHVGTRTSLVYLANPNNPTGTWFSTAALDQFLSKLRPNALVIVDEAYFEYVTDPALSSAIALLAKYPNLIVTRTFSKAYGLAGLRVGYACAHPRLLAVLERVRESFNVNTPGLLACAAALGDQDHVQTVRRCNELEREWLAGQLGARGLAVAASQTNFLLADFGREAAPFEAALVQRGIVLRPMAGYGLPNCLRITVGLRQENLRLLAMLDEVLA
jgi:histidinol-phosphate aminotransferase